MITHDWLHSLLQQQELARVRWQNTALFVTLSKWSSLVRCYILQRFPAQSVATEKSVHFLWHSPGCVWKIKLLGGPLLFSLAPRTLLFFTHDSQHAFRKPNLSGWPRMPSLVFATENFIKESPKGTSCGWTIGGRKWGGGDNLEKCRERTEGEMRLAVPMEIPQWEELGITGRRTWALHQKEHPIRVENAAHWSRLKPAHRWVTVFGETGKKIPLSENQAAREWLGAVV